MKKALTIAGSDSCGGAGIQADIKTMTMNGVYAMSAVTALTAQNTTGVRSVMEAAPAFLADQLDAVFEDIRRRAEELNEENARLRRELEQHNERRVELGDALLSAQSVYQDVVDKARVRADAITAEAEKRSQALLAETRRESEQILARSRKQEENAARRVEAAFDRMKQLHLASVDALNAQWQAFLCSLDGEEEPESVREEPRPAEPEPEELPADLEEKVGAIAQELFAMEQE